MTGTAREDRSCARTNRARWHSKQPTRRALHDTIRGNLQPTFSLVCECVCVCVCCGPCGSRSSLTSECEAGRTRRTEIAVRRPLLSPCLGSFRPLVAATDGKRLGKAVTPSATTSTTQSYEHNYELYYEH